MIDLKAEKLISPAEASKLVPPNRLDRPVHVSTVVRWILHGVRGVRLEAVRIGGRWATTEEAMSRFSAALTAKYAVASDEPAASKSFHTAKVDHVAESAHQQRVEQKLAQMGMA